MHMCERYFTNLMFTDLIKWIIPKHVDIHVSYVTIFTVHKFIQSKLLIHVWHKQFNFGSLLYIWRHLWDLDLLNIKLLLASLFHRNKTCKMTMVILVLVCYLLNTNFCEFPFWVNSQNEMVIEVRHAIDKPIGQ